MRTPWKPLLASWNTLQSNLQNRLRLRPARERFRAARAHAALDRFPSPEELVDYLAHAGGNPSEKTRILQALVTMAQRRGPEGDLGFALLMLGLWPGLKEVFWRWASCFRKEPDELASRIACQFTTSVLRADLAKVDCIAGTLVMSTERGLREWWARGEPERRLRGEMPATADRDTRRASMHLDESPLGFPVAMSEAARLAEVRAWLVVEAGEGGAFVYEMAADDIDCRELAARHGVSYEAMRKRCLRALDPLKPPRNPKK